MQRRTDPPELIPLFDAVVASPDDDAPRQVLADALAERGDERGEFIALQLLAAKGQATAAQRSREQALLDGSWARWLAEVPGLGKTPTHVEGGAVHFRRGFPESAVFSPTGVGRDSPVWRTVRRLDLAGPGLPSAAELASPHLESLEALTGLDAAALQVVLQGPPRPRLRELGFAGPHMLGDRARREQTQVLALTRFPSLKTLSLAPSPFRHHADWLDWLFASELARQLGRLRLWMELPFDVSGLHAKLIRHGLDALTLEVATMGVRTVLDARWLTVQFDSDFWFGRHAASLRNMGSWFAPFPYREFEVKVGGRAATPEELERLGETFTRHVRSVA
ncbi:MAG: TIGR02996 domain-containing protein [Myxococcota bacterium]